ncbi:S41 family peptidase [Chryseobacterium arthrosphaerae]|uniref:S41 family peptidase n=1 Tax=Chryseobacterium arthrosphaerae TaxID=651561 RepID=UPI0023E27C0B|nr:S41 family peptidase [Chryseobacterium arthrosphaerae]WES98458.1 S41 family peptidase [Chryseobacterium arthrosphaerae]
MTKPFLIPLLLLMNSAYAQTGLELKPGDTLEYTPKSDRPVWISVQSGDANLGVSLFMDGKKIREQDDSRGIKSVERLYFSPEKGRKYEFKIWAKSYLEKARAAKVSVTESKMVPVLKDRITSEQFVEDLHTFRTIREKVNSGLYVYRSKKEIDSMYQLAETEAANCKSIFDFYKVIARLTGFEGSCHNYTDLPNHASYYLTQKPEYLPVTLKNVDGRLLQDSKDVALPLGAEILSVNGVSAKEMISRFSQYYFSDGYSMPYKEITGFERGMLDKFYIEFGTHKNYVIRYQWNGKENEVSLPGISLENFKKLQESRHSLTFDKKLLSEKYSFTKEGEGIYRLSLRGFDFATGKEDPAYKKFSTFLDQMMDTLEKEKIQNLIVDLRGNTGGTGALYEKVFSYLTQRPFRDSHYAYTKFNEVPMEEKLVITPLFLSNGVTDKNGLNAYLKSLYPKAVQEKYYWADDKNPSVLPHEKTFKGQLYLLVDHRVASAASHLASLIKSYTNVVVIGKETVGGYYEHNGHLPLVYELPNTGIQTGFSIVHVIQDAQNLPDQKKGQGIIPHIEVHQTGQEFLDQTDVYLKKALELKKK